VGGADVVDPRAADPGWQSAEIDYYFFPSSTARFS